jgi:hypothetical protein
VVDNPSLIRVTICLAYLGGLALLLTLYYIQRMVEFRAVLGVDAARRPWYDPVGLYEHLEFTGANILVVRLHALPKVLRELKRSLAKLRKGLKRVAELRFDAEELKSTVVKIGGSAGALCSGLAPT